MLPAFRCSGTLCRCATIPRGESHDLDPMNTFVQCKSALCLKGRSSLASSSFPLLAPALTWLM